MQIEQNEIIYETPIENYQNKKRKIKLIVKQAQILYLNKNGVIIIYKDTPGDVQDVIDFLEIKKVTSLKKNDKNIDVVVIQLKQTDKPEISFRVSSEVIAQDLIRLIGQKKEEVSNFPDYTDLEMYKDCIIEKIKQLEPEYKEIYETFSNKIPMKKLRDFLFEDHKDIIEYNRLAREKGVDKDRTIRLQKIKLIEKRENIKILEQERILEGYDNQKCLEGIRLHDQEKIIKYEPSNEEIDDERFFNQFPNVIEENICDHFANIQEQRMDIQKQNKAFTVQSDVRHVMPLSLEKPQKGKYKISQSKHIFDNSYNRPDRKKEDKQDLNVQRTKKISLILKIFYKLLKSGETNMEEISSVENQLYRINSSQKPPLYLQNAIKKTLKNILQWKRQYGARN